MNFYNTCNNRVNQTNSFRILIVLIIQSLIVLLHSHFLGEY